MEDNKKRNHKNKIILIIIVTFLLISVLLYFILPTRINNQEENKGNLAEQKNSETENNALKIYTDEDQNICKEYNNECKNLAITIPTEKPNPIIIQKTGNIDDGYILFKDNDLIKLHITKDNDLKVLQLVNPNYNYYELIFTKNNNDNVLKGISYTNTQESKTDCNYYDINEEKIKYEGYCISEKILTNDRLLAYHINENDSNDMQMLVINDNTNTVEITIHNTNNMSCIHEIDNYLVYKDSCVYNESNFTYYKNGKQINNQPISGYMISRINDIFYYYEGNNFIKTNANTNETITTKNTQYDVKGIKFNYATVINNNILYLLDLDYFKEYKILDWKDNYSFYMIEASPKKDYINIFYYQDKEFKTIEFNTKTKEFNYEVSKQ